MIEDVMRGLSQSVSLGCHYEQLEFIGKGAFSQVYKIRIDQKIYALKRIYPYLLQQPYYHEHVMRQIDIMKTISHPNIIKFYDYIQEVNSISLILQYVSGGTLYERLKTYQRLPETEVKSYLASIIQAFLYLHSRQIPVLHRDLKPQNILLDEGKCKLADFGSANLMDGKRNSYVGTKEYMAPQMDIGESYNESIDIWGIGVLIYELLTGQNPTNQLNFPLYLSRAAEDVIRRLLTVDPKERMTLKELKDHVWMLPLPIESYVFQEMKIDWPKCNIEATIAKSKALTKNYLQNRKQEYQQKGTLENKQDRIKMMVSEYIQLLQEKNNLLYNLQHNAIILEKESRREKLQNPFLVKQLSNTEKKLEILKNKIEDIEKYPITFETKCLEAIEELKGKVTSLLYDATNLPRALEAKCCSFPEYTPEEKTLPTPDWVLRQKTQSLCQLRDALIQLKEVRQNLSNFQQLQRFQESLQHIDL